MWPRESEERKQEQHKKIFISFISLVIKIMQRNAVSLDEFPSLQSELEDPLALSTFIQIQIKDFNYRRQHRKKANLPIRHKTGKVG